MIAIAHKTPRLLLHMRLRRGRLAYYCAMRQAQRHRHQGRPNGPRSLRDHNLNVDRRVTPRSILHGGVDNVGGGAGARGGGGLRLSV